MARKSLNRIRTRIKAIIFAVTALTAITILFAVYVFFLLRRRIINPLAVLQAGAQTIEEGNYNHLIDIRSKDEIGSLSGAFISMAKSIDERTSRLQQEVSERKQAEERNRLLLESAGEGIFGIDLKGSVSFINPAALKMLGYLEEEIKGKNAHDLLHHSYADGSKYPIEKCPTYHSYTYGTIHHERDEVYWRKDGSSFFVAYTSTGIAKEGQLFGTIVTFMDITEQREAEESLETARREAEKRSSQLQKANVELRESEAVARGLLDATQETLFLLDKEGVIMAANQTGAARLFKKPNELVGITVFRFLPSELQKSTRANFDEVIKLRTAKEFEYALIGQYFLTNYYPVIDERGNVVAVAVFAKDITEQHEAEEALKNATNILREKEAQLSNAIKHMAGGIFMVDKDLNMQVFNERAFDYYHFPRERTQKGMPLENFLRFRAERGDYGRGDPDKLLAKRIAEYRDSIGSEKVVQYEDQAPGRPNFGSNSHPYRRWGNRARSCRHH